MSHVYASQEDVEPLLMNVDSSDYEGETDISLRHSNIKNNDGIGVVLDDVQVGTRNERRSTSSESANDGEEQLVSELIEDNAVSKGKAIMVPTGSAHKNSKSADYMRRKLNSCDRSNSNYQMLDQNVDTLEKKKGVESESFFSNARVYERTRKHSPL